MGVDDSTREYAVARRRGLLNSVDQCIVLSEANRATAIELRVVLSPSVAGPEKRLSPIAAARPRAHSQG